MIKEFGNLEGGIQQLSEAEDIGTIEPKISKFAAIYHPAQEIFYRDKKIICQVCEMSDTGGAFVLVPGYKMSESYKNKEGVLSVKVMPVEEENRNEIKGIVKKIIDNKYKVHFW